MIADSAEVILTLPVVNNTTTVTTRLSNSRKTIFVKKYICYSIFNAKEVVDEMASVSCLEKYNKSQQRLSYIDYYLTLRSVVMMMLMTPHMIRRDMRGNMVGSFPRMFALWSVINSLLIAYITFLNILFARIIIIIK